VPTPDPPLEEAGFAPSVPRKQPTFPRWPYRSWNLRIVDDICGAESPEPLSSISYCRDSDPKNASKAGLHRQYSGVTRISCEGPMVCRLAAGASGIRTPGSAQDWSGCESGISLHSATDDRRHPVRRATRRSGLDRLALKVMNRGNRREVLAIDQAVHINDRSCARRHFRDCRDEYAATATNQEIAGAGSEAVILHQRPVIRPNFE